MIQFSGTILDYWHAPFANGETLHGDGGFSLFVNPELDDENRVTVVSHAAGGVAVALTPAIADQLGLRQRQPLSEAVFRQMLSAAGIVLHGADHLHYFTESGKAALLRQSPAPDVRRLTAEDANMFAAFQAAASEQDRDDAYVELDHWAVFGAFAGEHLVGAASAYPWNDAPLADLGALTLTEFRGQGHARKLVEAICRHAYDQGHEPQYRCQFDHHVSQRLAKAAGLTLFGTWEVPAADTAEAEEER